MRFEWDEAKNAANKRKHRLSFQTAQFAFNDPLHRSFYDGAIDGEDRWQTFGIVDGVVLLLVALTYRRDGDDEIVRFISARKATKHERRRYEEG